MQLKDIIEKATLVDVRDELELMVDGKIDVAIHIPMAEIEQRAEEFKDMPKPVIIFCRSGNRAGKAIEYLNSLGIEDLHNGLGLVDMKKIIS